MQAPAALLKRDSSADFFPWILRDFLEHLFFIWLSMLYKIGVLKNLPKFTAKFMWTASSNISDNRPCLAGCKFIDVLENWLSVSIQGIEPFHEVAVFNLSCTD